MNAYKYIIIGGGTAAGYAAREFVNQNISRGDLCIVSAENMLPMDRPALSKDYLKNEATKKDLLINDQDFYDQNGVAIFTGIRVKKVKFAEKKLKLENGESLKYGKLLITTGSKIKHAGLPNDDLENIFYLRTARDSNKITDQAKKSKNVVVMGGGYIGAETAAIMSQMGLEVTMVVPEKALLAGFASDEISKFFHREFEKHNVKILFNESVVEFEGDQKVEQVLLQSGKSLPADMVIAGLGVTPNVDLFTDSHLNINQGIIVNRFCQTNIQDVFAAGDVVEFPDMIFDRIRHFEHWENAHEQGAHAAKVMTGTFEPYIFMPYFFSDVLEYSYEYFGDNDLATDFQNRGNFETGDFSTWWFKDERVIAAFIMSSRPDEEREMAKELIKNRASIEKEKIADPEFDLKALLVH
jgi:3-phenylpropionate/trans-cinnamate dioxygenase ferredoxin reductase component